MKPMTKRERFANALARRPVDFTVKDRAGWEEHAKPFLVEVDRRRISFEGYRESRRKAAENEEYFMRGGLAPLCRSPRPSLLPGFLTCPPRTDPCYVRVWR